MEPSGNKAHEKIPDADSVFVWQDYLDATESTEVPQILFPHVELTLQSGIEIGMSLEVPTRKFAEDEEISYWVASIVMACGPLLRLRYFGGDDRSLEFWFNLTKEAAHELGWCVRNNKKLEPPEEIFKRSPDCLEKLPDFLIKAKSVPQEMLSGEGLSMVDRIKQGMKVEVSDVRHPYKLWDAIIIENVGGRLLLRYDTPGSSPMKDFWIFCTSERLHRHGFSTTSDAKWFLEPPSSIIDSHAYEDWKNLSESGPKNYDLNTNHFDNAREHPRHKFEMGMKLETISPADKTTMCPASVVKVFDDIYFLVRIDVYDEDATSDDLNDSFVYDSPEKDTWLCTAEHPYIFPIGWAEKHDIRLTHPQGWISKSVDFNWKEYLKETKSVAADDSLFSAKESAQELGFETGMRLEAVDPENENVICAAHITKIVNNLLWLKLDNYEDCRPEHVVHIHSLQIFPVGWCESNHYHLKPPKDYVEVCSKLQVPMTAVKKSALMEISVTEPRSSHWCPKIYFNYRCFTGPMISKGKLATLPKAVGPGPVILVMREVLSMIVSVGYRSARILKVLQCDTKAEPGYHLDVLKAKHKNNTYRASVSIVTSGDMVADFCRSICQKLMVCPNLFGPLRVLEDECPDRCHNTSKTKFTQVGTGKRGKPKGYTSIMVQKPKPWSIKRRKRRGRWANRDKDNNESFTQNEEMPYLSMDLAKHISNNSEENREDRTPPSEADSLVQKGSRSSEKYNDFKNEVPSSNASEDSRLSDFNDRKSKDSNIDSPGSFGSKSQSKSCSQNGSSARGAKRERDCDTSIESDGSDDDEEYVRMQKKQRRPKTRKLESNPLFWSVDDVFRYLRKTNDCKDIAYRVRQEEIDGLAFLLLNLPSLTDHMKLRKSAAMKLCRHVEQVKVTFFLRHINEVEPEEYQIL